MEDNSNGKKGSNDHAKHEITTASQERLIEAAINRLYRRGYQGAVFVNVAFAMKTKAKKGVGLCLRAPDFALVTHGIVLEDDGSAHDGHDKRRQRDTARESDWDDLKFYVIRFSSQEISSDEGLIRVVSELEKLMNEVENHPDFAKRYRVRRTKIQRRLKEYETAHPERILRRNEPSTTARLPTTQRRSRGRKPAPYKIRYSRGGRIYKLNSRRPRKKPTLKPSS